MLLPGIADEPLGRPELLEQGSVNRPSIQAPQGVPAQVAHATQAGRGEKSVRKTESVGPLRMGRIHMVRLMHWDGHLPPRLGCSPPRIDTFGRIEIAGSQAPVFHWSSNLGREPPPRKGTTGRRFGTTKSVPLPSAVEPSQGSLSLREKREFPYVIEGKSVTDVEDGVTAIQTGDRQVSASPSPAAWPFAVVEPLCQLDPESIAWLQV